MSNGKQMTTDERIDHLAQRFDELLKRIDLLSKGDQQLGMKGYSQRIAQNEETLLDHERRMNDIDRRFDKVYQRVIGIALGVTIAASVVGWVIQNSVTVASARQIDTVQRMYVPHMYNKPLPNKLDTKKVLIDSNETNTQR